MTAPWPTPHVTPAQAGVHGRMDPGFRRDDVGTLDVGR